MTTASPAPSQERIDEKASGECALSSTLRRRVKILTGMVIAHQTFYEAIADQTGHRATQGSIREVFLISMLRNSGNPVFFSSTGDFDVGDVTFEVGGKNKSGRQLKEATGASFRVKDDILYGGWNEMAREERPHGTPPQNPGYWYGPGRTENEPHAPGSFPEALHLGGKPAPDAC